MENNEISISRMTEADISEIALLEERCFSVPWHKEAFVESLGNDHCRFYAARLTCDANAIYEGAICNIPKGTLAGYAGFIYVPPFLSDDEESVYFGCADVMNIAVAPELRRRGFARKLLERITDDARSLWISSLMLEVRESNISARTLYKSFGFVENGMRKNYYTKPRENAILMQMDIDPDGFTGLPEF